MDILIKGGLVVDGTVRQAAAADIVVSGDRIADVVAPGAAKGDGMRVIDAAGCLVTPGFVDAHAHSDAYLVIEPDAPSKLAQGVTTEINGQCGGSVARVYEGRWALGKSAGGGGCSCGGNCQGCSGCGG